MRAEYVSTSIIHSKIKEAWNKPVFRPKKKKICFRNVQKLLKTEARYFLQSAILLPKYDTLIEEEDIFSKVRYFRQSTIFLPKCGTFHKVRLFRTIRAIAEFYVLVETDLYTSIRLGRTVERLCQKKFSMQLGFTQKSDIYTSINFRRNYEFINEKFLSINELKLILLKEKSFLVEIPVDISK